MERISVGGLLAVLESEGSRFSVERGKSVVATFSRYRGDDLEFPTVISSSDDHFVAYMDVLGSQGRGPWPECEVREAGFRLLLVHLDEEFWCLDGNPDLIQIGPKDMYVRRTRPRPRDPLDDLPPGDYEWRA